jgi:DNA-binding transcriptional MerR regulator
VITKFAKEVFLMTIKEVCEKFDITPDTLRYYERVGVIPEVHRTKGGIRDFTDEDVAWVENAICMRSAGVPVEMLIEYVRLYQEGDGTFQARRDVLEEARQEVQKNIEKYQATLDRLNFKISRYDVAIKTGVLSWDDCKEE